MSEKSRLKNEEEYATYEEYNEIMDISMSLSNENQSLQSQLDIANKKLNKIKELIEDNEVYNGIEYILDPDKVFKTKDILSIIGGE